jgi:hypothetical protein
MEIGPDVDAGGVEVDAFQTGVVNPSWVFALLGHRVWDSSGGSAAARPEGVMGSTTLLNRIAPIRHSGRGTSLQRFPMELKPLRLDDTGYLQVRCGLLWFMPLRNAVNRLG